MVGTARSSVTTTLRPKLPLRATTNARKTLQEDPELPVCRGGRRADDQKSHLAFPVFRSHPVGSEWDGRHAGACAVGSLVAAPSRLAVTHATSKPVIQSPLFLARNYGAHRRLILLPFSRTERETGWK
ncbi:hypothetical protein C8034_v008253 [Colletotrichum sidae]|uniref:Uncharacterized protein n=1 Tax=Colletotrichum sidae TaxID=1347389 RepID=A0A4R8TQJ5_9PEZI|nr:hypothetical protein C8034_v008253 [Colletotrichum sidae]